MNKTIPTAPGGILVLVNFRMARLVVDAQRRPVDAVNVAQISVAEDDDVAPAELDQ